MKKIIIGLLIGYVLNEVASKLCKTKVEYGVAHYSSKYPKEIIITEIHL